MSRGTLIKTKLSLYDRCFIGLSILIHGRLPTHILIKLNTHRPPQLTHTAVMNVDTSTTLGTWERLKQNLKKLLTGIDARPKLPPSTPKSADRFPDGIQADVMDFCTVDLIEGGSESNVVIDKMLKYVPSLFDRSSFTTDRPPYTLGHSVVGHTASTS